VAVTVNSWLSPSGVRPLDGARVRAFHRSLGGYRPSPLRDLPAVASRLGVARVWVKDESDRFGLPAFKILGASWAVLRELSARVDLPADPPVSLADLRVALRARVNGSAPTTLVAATDGNHGRAVARMAALLGLAAVILVPRGTATARIEGIGSEGAEVVVHPGDYDDAVRAAAALASPTHVVISDTAWPGYEQVPAWVIEGYATIAEELAEELAALGEAPPTVAVAQIGVGAFAAGLVRALTPFGTRVLAVEPVTAACLAPSLAAGEPRPAAGALDSIMAGLNCGEVSPVAWPDLLAGVEAVVTVSDDDARAATRMLYEHGMATGESGAAGLAGLLHAPDLLRPDDRVLVVCTEGVTDPKAFAEIVGGVPPGAAVLTRRRR
jgi:diaminopropionate ammonia-lyase